MAVGINTHELEKIVIDENEDFASMFEQFEKKRRRVFRKVRLLQLKMTKWSLQFQERKRSIISIDEIKDAQGKLLFKEGDSLPIVIIGKRNEQPIVSYKKAIRREKVRQYIKDLGEDYRDKVIEAHCNAKK